MGKAQCGQLVQRLLSTTVQSSTFISMGAYDTCVGTSSFRRQPMGGCPVTHPQLTSACVCELRFYDNQPIADWPSLSFGSMDAMPLGNPHLSIFEYLYTSVLIYCFSHFVVFLTIFVISFAVFTMYSHISAVFLHLLCEYFHPTARGAAPSLSSI